MYLKKTEKQKRNESYWVILLACSTPWYTTATNFKEVSQDRTSF